jgi:cation diffusion facilitator CzcD-associated flavoprotein CzcO
MYNMKMDYQIGIIGAGFAGLVAALRLKKSGRESFLIFERAGEIGGTWRDNTYPGCACDVASPLYSFSQELNPAWSRLFSPQPEILTYMKDVVQKNNLEPHIRYNTDIVEAQFYKETGGWVVKDRAGSTTTVQVLIAGTGPLNRPSFPVSTGMDTFRGRSFHTAQWDPTYNLRGKKVAVIGTGASAIQLIPEIAPVVDHLTVFQRTPAWVTPRKDKAFTEKEKRRFSRFPLLMKLRREAIYWFNEMVGLGFTGNAPINRIMRSVAVRRLTKQVNDPALRRRLTPSYKIGCKRILISNDYYTTFNRKNVTLVTDTIESFIPEGIVAGGKQHHFDAVVFATGFVAADIELYVKIIGPDGDNLIDHWKTTGAEAYLGTTVAGYPNLCFLLGPNTGLGSNSVVHMMESQMNYIMQYILHLETAGIGSYFDLKPEVQENYNTKLQKKFKGTVWSSGCKSWYLNRAGKNTTLFPRLASTFRRLTKKFDPAVYRQSTATVRKQQTATSH